MPYRISAVASRKAAISSTQSVDLHSTMSTARIAASVWI